MSEYWRRIFLGWQVQPTQQQRQQEANLIPQQLAAMFGGKGGWRRGG